MPTHRRVLNAFALICTSLMQNAQAQMPQLSTHWPGIFMVENNPIPDAFVQYLDNNLPDRKTHKIYLDYGTAALDSLYKPYQQQADAVKKKHGWKKKQWITLEFPGADHSEAAWKARLDKPLGFLLK